MFRDLFQYTLVTYLILLLIETVWGKRVSHFLDLNNFLIAVIVSGVMADFFSVKKLENSEKVSRNILKGDYFLMSIFGIISVLIVWYKSASLGSLLLLLLVVSELAIVLLLMLVFVEKDGATSIPSLP